MLAVAVAAFGRIMERSKADISLMSRRQYAQSSKASQRCSSFVVVSLYRPQSTCVAASRPPVRPLPPALAKTQVEGTHFPHGDRLPPPPAAVTAAVERAAGSDGAAPAPPIELGAESASTGALVTIEVTPLEAMTSGKLCA